MPSYEEINASYFVDKTEVIEEDLEFDRLTNNFSGCTGYKVIFEEDGLHFKKEILDYDNISEVKMVSNTVSFKYGRFMYHVVVDNVMLARKFYVKLLVTLRDGFEEIILESIDEIEANL